MTKEAIIKLVNDSDTFNAYIYSIRPEYLCDDLKQEVLITLNEKGEGFLNELVSNNKLSQYAVRIAKIKLMDSKGRFRGRFDHLKPAPYIPSLSVIASDTKALEGLTQIEIEYYKALTSANLNKSELARQTNIPRNLLTKIYESIENKVRVNKNGKDYTATIDVVIKCSGNVDKVCDVLEDLGKMVTDSIAQYTANKAYVKQVKQFKIK